MTTRFTTRGGPGSIHADLGSLEAVAARHQEAGEETMRLSGLMPGACGQLEPAARVSGSAAVLVERLERAAESLRCGGAGLGENSRDLTTVVGRYRDAERAASEVVVDAEVPKLEDLPTALDERVADGVDVDEAEFLVRAAIRGADEKAASMFLSGRFGAALEAVPLRPWKDGWKEKDESALTPEERAGKKRRSTFLGAGLGGAVEEAVHALGRLPGAPRATPHAFWEAVGQGAWAGGRLGPLMIVGGPSANPRAPQRLSGRLTELGELIPRAGEGEGAIIATEVRRADGGSTWIVTLPGTQGGVLNLAGGDNWADAGGNAEALGLGSPMVADGVARALRAAGAPDGADVVLTGFSQGGAHAVNLSAHPDFAGRYRVRAAVSVGSPNGDLVAPPDVAVLEFAARSDLYPGADGGRNAVSHRRATVLFEDEGDGAPPPVLAPGTASRQAWDAAAPQGRGVPALAGSAARVAGSVDPLGREMDAIHDLERYMERIKDFEDAPTAERAQVQGLQDEIAGWTTGAVVSSQVVRLKRWRHTDPRLSSRSPGHADAPAP